MKVLVTGDRWWNDIKMVVDVLEQLPPTTTVVHGGCQGADIIADVVARALGFVVTAYPVVDDEWKRLGHAAGPIRNQRMLDEQHLPDDPINLVIAFHDDIENSRGTKDMLRRATKAKIEHKLYTHPRSSGE